MTSLGQEVLERLWCVRLYEMSDVSLNYITQKATWHVPAGQESVAQRGAAAAPETSDPPTSSTSSPKQISRVPSHNNSITKSSFLSIGSHRSNTVDSGLTVEIALKVIPKKKVKGNEDSVWGEMEVLKGLDHKNIVGVMCSSLQHSSLTSYLGQVL